MAGLTERTRAQTQEYRRRILAGITRFERSSRQNQPTIRRLSIENGSITTADEFKPNQNKNPNSPLKK